MSNTNTQYNNQPSTTEPLDINTQIEEFFKKGGAIKKIPENNRAIPEWLWWQDNYPKNYRR